MIIYSSILLLLSLSPLALAAGNPGILISVPFPLKVPTITLPLPIPIENIVISNLELTQTNLQELDYLWNFAIKKADVNVTSSHIIFNWNYKGHSGIGFFTEENLSLQFYYSFIASNTNHLQINVTTTKIHPGHSKVTLGGGIPETILVEVTNLVLNHASILFRGFISTQFFDKGKQLSKTISELTSSIAQDKHIYTEKSSGSEFYLNISLVAPPILSGDNLIVQLNGASYVRGKSSGELNPLQILIRTNSTKIQVQIHQKVISYFLSVFLKAIGGEYSLTLHSRQITSTLDINSLLLSPIFPPMADYSDNRDVIFNLKIPTIDFSFNENNLRFDMNVFSNVYTYNSIDRRDELYIDRIDGKLSAQIFPIFGKMRNSIRIKEATIVNFEPRPSDVASGRIIPEAITGYFGFLADWLADAINLQLNRKVVTFQYKDIRATLNGKVINNVAYYLQIDLNDKNK